MDNKFKLPTEIVKLPSQGKVYPKDNPLSSGEIEMSYMTAVHEDILTNKNYMKQGIVIDKLLQALIVSPIKYEDLIIGDKNSILISARILGYGQNYSFPFKNPVTKETEDVSVDLSELKEKNIPLGSNTEGMNEFNYTLPHSTTEITFKLLTHGDETRIEKEIEGLKKIKPNESFDSSTRLKHAITSVGGSRDPKDIREFVEKYMLAKDSKALREYIKTVSPDVLLEFDYDKNGYAQEGISIPIGLDFFWPS